MVIQWCSVRLLARLIFHAHRPTCPVEGNDERNGFFCSDRFVFEEDSWELRAEKVFNEKLRFQSLDMKRYHLKESSSLPTSHFQMHVLLNIIFKSPVQTSFRVIFESKNGLGHLLLVRACCFYSHSRNHARFPHPFCKANIGVFQEILTGCHLKWNPFCRENSGVWRTNL